MPISHLEASLREELAPASWQVTALRRGQHPEQGSSGGVLRCGGTKAGDDGLCRIGNAWSEGVNSADGVDQEQESVLQRHFKATDAHGKVWD